MIQCVMFQGATVYARLWPKLLLQLPVRVPDPARMSKVHLPGPTVEVTSCTLLILSSVNYVCA